MIDKFEGEFFFLSNFFVERDGTSVEHEFQAAKAIKPEECEWVLAAPTPGEAKKRGRQVEIMPNWEDIKLGLMYVLVGKKFHDWPELAQRLRLTGDQDLVEGNWWGDRFWGVCKGEGENHLGKILMRVREELTNGGRSPS